jgi:hypothetical protein
MLCLDCLLLCTSSPAGLTMWFLALPMSFVHLAHAQPVGRHCSLLRVAVLSFLPCGPVQATLQTPTGRCWTPPLRHA